MIAVSCECGKTFKAKPEYAGRQVKCPKCKDPLRIPMSKKKSASPQRKTKPKSAAMDSLLDDVGVLKAGSAGSCPKCKEQLTEDAVLCVNCGYHLEGGKQLGTKSLIRKSSGYGRAHLGSEMHPGLPPSLKSLVSLTKVCGILMLVLGPISLSIAVAMASMPEVAEKFQSLLPNANALVLGLGGFIACVAGTLSIVVSGKAKRGEPAARSLGFLTAFLMLLLVPIGSLISLIMLAKLLHGDTKRFYR